MDELSQNEFWSGPQEVKLPSSGLYLKVCLPTRQYLLSQCSDELKEKVDLLRMSLERPKWSPGENREIWKVIQTISEHAIARGVGGRLEEAAEIFNLLNDDDTQFLFDLLYGSLDADAYPAEENRVTVN